VCRLTRIGAVPQSINDCRSDESRSGGCLLDWGVLDFDWARWTLGEVIRVHAVMASWQAGEVHKEYALATLRHESGCITYLELSWAHPDCRYTIDISGRTGKIEFDSTWIRREKGSDSELSDASARMFDHLSP
jgi:predicted dehydrogenase